MSALLDTSMVVRYLTGDPPHLAEAAAKVIDRDAADPLLVTDVVIVEAAYVLMSVYEVPREAVVDHLMGLILKRNLGVWGFTKSTVLNALMLCRPSGRVSLADAFIWAAATDAKVPVVYTLDQRFPSDGLEIRRADSGG